MALDIFLKLDTVVGESADKTHRKEIDVLFWSWGMLNTRSAHAGGGAGTGKGYVKDLTVTKYVDKSSPALMLGCCSGTHYPSALLTVRKVGGKEPVEYLKIKMQEVFISSVSTRNDTNCFQMSEELILNCAKVSVDYTPQNPDGSKGIAIPFRWDIPSNCTE